MSLLRSSQRRTRGAAQETEFARGLFAEGFEALRSWSPDYDCEGRLTPLTAVKIRKKPVPS
jgi:hypothetical protein